MTKHIAEELPTRKHAPAAAAAPAAQGGEGGKGDEKDPEKKVRQAVYDIRYRARREDVPLRTAYSQYMSNSNLGANERSAVKAKLFGDGPVKEARELAADSVANAMVRVFVGEERYKGKHGQSSDEYKRDRSPGGKMVSGDDKQSGAEYTHGRRVKAENPGSQPDEGGKTKPRSQGRMDRGTRADLEYRKANLKKLPEEVEQVGKDKKYKVRVEDKSGKSYVRYADRAKITELRANPNIRSVEITSYGEPYEGERKKGERTAAAKAGKDYDGDGKVESPSKEHAGAVHNAIQRRTGGKPDGQDTRRDTNEEFIADAVAEATEKKLDILPKDQVNTVKVHGKKGSGNANGVTESKEVMKSVVSRFRDKMKEREEQGKEAEKFAADTCDKCGKFPCECDDRARKTSMDLYKNKLRSMGLKMSYEPEGDNVEEGLTDLQRRRYLGRRPGEEKERLKRINDRKVKKAALAALEKHAKGMKAGIYDSYESEGDEIDEVTYPSDFKKGSGVAKRKYGRPQQHDQETDRSGRRKTVDEETEDSLKDKRMERGGVGGNQRYDRPPAKKASNAELGIKPGKTAVQKELEKRHGKGASAMDIVRAELEKKHGKGAVMSTKKKEEKEEENEKEED